MTETESAIVTRDPLSPVRSPQAYALDLRDALRYLADPLHVMDTGCTMLARFIRVQAVAYIGVDDSGTFGTVERDWSNDSMGVLPRWFPLSGLGLAIVEALASGQSVAINSTAGDDRIAGAGHPTPFGDGAAAFLAAPLVKSNRLVGLLMAISTEPRNWSASAVEAAVETAELTWAAVERARAQEALRDSEHRLRLASEAAGLGIYEFDVARKSSVWSHGLRRILGITQDGEISQDIALATIHPDDRATVSAAMLAVMQSLGPYAMEFRVLRQDGTVRWVLDSGESLGPPDSVTGFARRVVGTVMDITERKRTEDLLRRSYETYLRLIEQNPFGVYLVDSHFRLARISRGAQKVFSGTSPLLGRDFAAILRTIWAEPFATEAIDRFRHTLETGESYESPNTTQLRGNVEAIESYDWRIERITLPDDTYGVVCYFYDLTDRKQYEEQIRLLMHEVNHRANNMLSLVAAVARNTAANRADDFLSSFESRIQSLAVNQELLVRSDWTSIQIGELARLQLAHFVDLVGTRILVGGPAMALKPAAAQALGMALHELATNAGKYGALSGDAGTVRIAWTLDAPDTQARSFHISWRETGGPPVTPPTRRGFGSTVLHRMVRMTMGGTVTLDFAPDGLVWSLICPAEKALAQAPATAAPDTTALQFATGEAGGASRILIVEDEPLLALEMAETLVRAGFLVAGPAATVHDAMQILDAMPCGAAVLDVNLGAETAERIADRLVATGIPFITVTASSADGRPAVFDGVPLLAKPVSGPALVAEIRRSLAMSAALAGP